VSRSPTVGLAVIGLLAVGISGCHGFEPTVRRGMSVDARCPEEKIEVKPLGEGAYQASGCGKSTVYECSWPEGRARTCTPRGVPPSKGLPGTGF